MTINIDLTKDEQDAITAAVERQRETEPDLTAEALIARMAKKLAVGWAHELRAERSKALTNRLAEAMKTATPEQTQRALQALGAE